MFGPDFFGAIFGRPGRGGADPRRARMFERGDLRYVILDFLKAKPAHGYELIRALEERFHGRYAPSPGVVYPTLQYLEDLGYLSVEQRDGKKIYTITEEGRKFLQANQQVVDDIWGRVSGWAPEPHVDFGDMQQQLRNFAQQFGTRMQAGRVDEAKWRRIRAVITRAIREIEDIVEERDGSRTTEL